MQKNRLMLKKVKRGDRRKTQSKACRRRGFLVYRDKITDGSGMARRASSFKFLQHYKGKAQGGMTDIEEGMSIIVRAGLTSFNVDHGAVQPGSLAFASALEKRNRLTFGTGKSQGNKMPPAPTQLTDGKRHENKEDTRISPLYEPSSCFGPCCTPDYATRTFSPDNRKLGLPKI